MYRQSRGEHYRKARPVSAKRSRQYLVELREDQQKALAAGDTEKVARLQRSIQQHEENLAGSR